MSFKNPIVSVTKCLITPLFQLDYKDKVILGSITLPLLAIDAFFYFWYKPRDHELIKMIDYITELENKSNISPLYAMDHNQIKRIQKCLWNNPGLVDRFDERDPLFIIKVINIILSFSQSKFNKNHTQLCNDFPVRKDFKQRLLNKDIYHNGKQTLKELKDLCSILQSFLLFSSRNQGIFEFIIQKVTPSIHYQHSEFILLWELVLASHKLPFKKIKTWYLVSFFNHLYQLVPKCHCQVTYTVNQLANILIDRYHSVGGDDRINIKIPMTVLQHHRGYRFLSYIPRQFSVFSFSIFTEIYLTSWSVFLGISSFPQHITLFYCFSCNNIAIPDKATLLLKSLLRFIPMYPALIWLVSQKRFYLTFFPSLVSYFAYFMFKHLNQKYLDLIYGMKFDQDFQNKIYG